jgi:regulator of sigma E protease
MSILIFLGVLFILILVHEWGHFIVAKKTGMRVDEFGIGFPPKAFSIKKGETEYSFNWLPIGGFVRIFGENLDADKNDIADNARAFGNRPKWAQALVLIAGVTMNVIFAWFLFFLTFMMGVPTAVEESKASESAILYVSGVLPNSPLYENLPVGSEITSIASAEAQLINPTPSAFTGFIQANSERELNISYTFGKEESEVSVLPVSGLISTDKDRKAVGVSLAMVDTVDYTFTQALITASDATVSGLAAITVGLYELIAGSVSGTADLSQVAGPVGIVGMVGDAADFGIAALLTFTAIISLNLAIINLLPIPALDGGRLVFVAIEAVTRKPINPIWAGRVNLVGFALLMILMVVVTYNDIVRIFA